MRPLDHIVIDITLLVSHEKLFHEHGCADATVVRVAAPSSGASRPLAQTSHRVLQIYLEAWGKASVLSTVLSLVFAVEEGQEGKSPVAATVCEDCFAALGRGERNAR